MNLASAIVISVTLSSLGCSPVHRAQSKSPSEQTRLSACSAELVEIFYNRFETFGYETMNGAEPWLEDGSPRRAKAIAIASRWALEQCYMPCAYEMCGLPLRKTDETDVYVYIHPVEYDRNYLVPEAQILLRGEHLELIEETMFHMGCRHDCREGASNPENGA